MRQTLPNGKLGSDRRRPEGRNVRNSGRALEIAREVAIDAFVFLSSDEERLLSFLNISGLRPQDLRAAAAGPGFYASILDHLSGDERLAAAFALEKGLSPEALQGAREALANGPGEA